MCWWQVAASREAGGIGGGYEPERADARGRQRQSGDLEPAETDGHGEGNGERHFEHDRAAGAAREMARGDPRPAAKAEKRGHPHVSANTSPSAANGWLRSSVAEVSVLDCGCPSIFHKIGREACRERERQYV